MSQEFTFDTLKKGETYHIEKYAKGILILKNKKILIQGETSLELYDSVEFKQIASTGDIEVLSTEVWPSSNHNSLIELDSGLIVVYHFNGDLEYFSIKDKAIIHECTIKKAFPNKYHRNQSVILIPLANNYFVFCQDNFIKIYNADAPYSQEPKVATTLNEEKHPYFESMIKLSNKNVIVGGYKNKLYFFDLDTLKINKEVDVSAGDTINHAIFVIQVNDDLLVSGMRYVNLKTYEVTPYMDSKGDYRFYGGIKLRDGNLLISGESVADVLGEDWHHSLNYLVNPRLSWQSCRDNAYGQVGDNFYVLDNNTLLDIRQEEITVFNY